MDAKHCELNIAHLGHNWSKPDDHSPAYWCPGHLVSVSPTAQEPLIKPPDAPWMRHPSVIGAGSDMKLSRHDALVALDQYISNRHCVIWGGIWTVTDTDRREDALDWFLDVAGAIGLLKDEALLPIQVVIAEDVIASVTPLHKGDQ